MIGPGIHQRAGERIAAILDHAGESASTMTASAWSLRVERKHAGRQPLGAHGDGDLERPVLARQPRQRAGLRKGHVGAIAGVMRSLGEQHRAEGCRRQEHHLAVGEMRREQPARCRPARWPAPGTGSARRRARPRPMSVGDAAPARTSWRPLKSLTRMRRPAARCAATACASRRHSRTSWPAMAKSPAAANEPLPPPSTAICIRSSCAGIGLTRCLRQFLQPEMLHLAQAHCAADRRRKRYRAAP